MSSEKFAIECTPENAPKFRTWLESRGGSGLSFKISDAAQRKLDKVMAQCEEKHGDAFYRKGVLDIDGASMGVYYTTGITPLSNWKE